jgi:hypothetical protein
VGVVRGSQKTEKLVVADGEGAGEGVGGGGGSRGGGAAGEHEHLELMCAEMVVMEHMIKVVVFMLLSLEHLIKLVVFIFIRICVDVCVCE